VKGKHNSTKQTVQFKLKDVTLFKTSTSGNLVCLPKNAPINLLMSADSTTSMLKLANQNNGCGKPVLSSFFHRECISWHHNDVFRGRLQHKLHNHCVKHSSRLAANAICSAGLVGRTPKCQNNSYIWSIPSEVVMQKVGQQGPG
jgi:hypothetical protein